MEVTYIEATPADVALANRLAHEVLGRSLDELARPSTPGWPAPMRCGYVRTITGIAPPMSPDAFSWLQSRRRRSLVEGVVKLVCRDACFEQRAD